MGRPLAGARHAVASLLDAECDCLLSFGVCGGLKDDVGVGDVILATQVVTTMGDRFQSDKAWLKRVETATQSLPFVRRGRLLGSDILVPDVATKRSYGLRFDALGVDMESHIAARAAQLRGLPFFCYSLCYRCDGSCYSAVSFSSHR